MGRPCTVTLCCPIPIVSALCLASSVATKQRSTFLWNQVLWHVVKSVTTVANLIGLWMPALAVQKLTECRLIQMTVSSN